MILSEGCGDVPFSQAEDEFAGVAEFLFGVEEWGKWSIRSFRSPAEVPLAVLYRGVRGPFTHAEATAPRDD